MASDEREGGANHVALYRGAAGCFRYRTGHWEPELTTGPWRANRHVAERDARYELESVYRRVRKVWEEPCLDEDEGEFDLWGYALFRRLLLEGDDGGVAAVVIEGTASLHPIKANIVEDDPVRRSQLRRNRFHRPGCAGSRLLRVPCCGTSDAERVIRHLRQRPATGGRMAELRQISQRKADAHRRRDEAISDGLARIHDDASSKHAMRQGRLPQERDRGGRE